MREGGFKVDRKVRRFVKRLQRRIQGDVKVGLIYSKDHPLLQPLYEYVRYINPGDNLVPLSPQELSPQEMLDNDAPIIAFKTPVEDFVMLPVGQLTGEDSFYYSLPLLPMRRTLREHVVREYLREFTGAFKKEFKELRYATETQRPILFTSTVEYNRGFLIKQLPYTLESPLVSTDLFGVSALLDFLAGFFDYFVKTPSKLAKSYSWKSSLLELPLIHNKQLIVGETLPGVIKVVAPRVVVEYSISNKFSFVPQLVKPAVLPKFYPVSPTPIWHSIAGGKLAGKIPEQLRESDRVIAEIMSSTTFTGGLGVIKNSVRRKGGMTPAKDHLTLGVITDWDTLQEFLNTRPPLRGLNLGLVSGISPSNSTHSAPNATYYFVPATVPGDILETPKEWYTVMEEYYANLEKIFPRY